MTIEEYREEYQIREFLVKKQNNRTMLSWRFKKGSHFLIFMYDSRYEFQLDAAVSLLEDTGITDREIVNNRSVNQLYNKENGKFKVFCLREKEFVQNGKIYTVPAAEERKGIPYEIRLFVCNYDVDEEELYIYKPEKKENLQYIPVVVKPEIRYEKKLFSRQATCVLKLPRLEDYKDGAMMYHIDGVSGDFPLPASCLGRELYIQVPEIDSVTVRIRDEFKKFYRKA